MHVLVFSLVLAGLEEDFNRFARRPDTLVPESKARAFWCIYIPHACPVTDNYDVQGLGGTFVEEVRNYALENLNYNLSSNRDGVYYVGEGVEVHVGLPRIENGLWYNQSRTMSTAAGEYVIATDVHHVAKQLGTSHNLCPCNPGLACVVPGDHMPGLCIRRVVETDSDRLWITVMALVCLAGVVAYVATEPYVQDGSFNTRQYLLRNVDT
jgi:hypothetical protein